MKDLVKARIRLPILITSVLLCLFALTRAVFGFDIDPVDKWSWSTNAGWVNFHPTCEGCEGATVYPDHLEGFAWGENVGWIRLGTHTGGGVHTYGNTSATDYGVNRDGLGNLSGYAWGTSVGWIRFDTEQGGATIDPASGSFDGYAWAENVGWIHFKNAHPAYNVVVSANRVYLPVVVKAYPPCIAAGELVWWDTEDHCCAGLSEVLLTHPCDPPGVGGCPVDGCYPIPPCACSKCAPCGDGICQSEYGENRCSCPSDCE